MNVLLAHFNLVFDALSFACVNRLTAINKELQSLSRVQIVCQYFGARIGKRPFFSGCNFVHLFLCVFTEWLSIPWRCYPLSPYHPLTNSIDKVYHCVNTTTWLLTEFLHNASGDLTNIVYYVAVIIHTLEEREKWKKEQEAGLIYDKLLPSS